MASVTMRIEFVSPIEQVDPEDDNIDVHVHLDDGRVYSLIVATPKNLYWCMDNEGNDHFFGIPPVFVRTLTVENVQNAVRELISADGGRWLSIYGSLQE
jgi:hypothetical protein